MSIKVVIADDHAVIRDGLRFLLEAAGDIKVVGTADNGREAVRQVQALEPDVVVMDIAMTDLNGIEATAQLLEAHSSTRVLILSMHHTPEHIFQAFRSGAKGYLLKESAGQEVVIAVRKLHAGHRYLSESIEESVIDDYMRKRQDTFSASPVEKLSSREREILQLVVEGKSSVEISKIIFFIQILLME